MPGHPDDQAYSQWVGPNLLSAYAFNLATGAHASGPLQVGQWKGIKLRCLPSAGYARVILSWFSDATEVNTIGVDTFPVNASTSLSALIPLKGPVCDLNLNVDSAANLVAQADLEGVNTAGQQITYPIVANEVVQRGLSVALSTTLTFPLPFIQGGLACINWSFADVGGKLAVAVVEFADNGNVANVLADLGTATVTTPFTQLVGLTGNPCGLRVVNSDGAAAHTVNMQLVSGLS